MDLSIVPDKPANVEEVPDCPDCGGNGGHQVADVDSHGIVCGSHMEMCAKCWGTGKFEPTTVDAPPPCQLCGSLEHVEEWHR